MDLTSLKSSSPVFIKDSLGQYYKMRSRKCKKFLTNKFIDSFLVSNRSVMLMVEDEDRSCVISHVRDLENRFPGNDLLRDEEQITAVIFFFLVFSLDLLSCYFECSHCHFVQLKLWQPFIFPRRKFGNALKLSIAILFLHNNIIYFNV